MSGHSKWANIKHRKAAQDAKRGNLFQKLVKAVIIAAKEGGGDPAMNMRLKAAIDRAKAASVPNDNIIRGIKRGTGEIEGAQYEEITYEAYGPNGVAILIEVLTDNRNRAASEIRAVLTRNGGSLGEAGSVAWMFERKGTIEVSGKDLDEEALMTVALEAGAEDLEQQDEGYAVYTDPASLPDVRDALEKAGYSIERAETEMVPKNTVQISDPEKARKVLRLMDLLEENDDTQNVYGNFDIPDEIMESLEG
ncbi:putative transcriptional regulatory protein [bioreactor metagenome]|uniref:Putative transcriptional regulatory protein n=1 Tax=bioreactor metagenome TaxID=1076179 RepID=A0A644XAD6_9ZZZZ|nr:YebC/PmpR family DNA-binding transcriptional regulator [Aminivibrio sp.]MDD3515291.1 YebC/PmpR family DNA-binding transcriptional regulator [Synergistaceae bacterium]NCB16870.1 YebC/PmpR family DNA-binding transcriptional regulator [Synergistales bacterium]MEA4953742.1 YebC/PmpR family DNA-binding transcriptional regulator [Aminivibrio sp.]HPK07141.1 YebC/PmpR family DNA-binding transcriptional regulator [Aminivibrio sp.]HRX25670.1 YebC/PmpR family DNA-binding transcriptional regulator [Ami